MRPHREEWHVLDVVLLRRRVDRDHVVYAVLVDHQRDAEPAEDCR